MIFRIDGADWKGALMDFRETLMLLPGAFLLAWRDVFLRYRGSLLGPFWYTVSTFLQIQFLGYLYPVIFSVRDAVYMRWLSMGLICWQFLSPALMGSEGVFTSARGIYTERRMPYSFFCVKYMILQVLVFLHQLPVVLYCIWRFDIVLRPCHLLSFFLGLVLVTMILFFLSFILGLLCLRFYDIPQLLSLLLYIAFMLTPVFWMPQMAASREALIRYNPFCYLLDVMRSPLMGADTEPASWAVALAALFLSALVAFILFARCRKRIAFY
ncbi:MAG: ABC transporter permease [Synergistaceae bacterium]|jgi:lipopolysaccharide transport system permease protein|nr:ABC transporter permease [Synergistaceae bacterium]